MAEENKEETPKEDASKESSQDKTAKKSSAKKDETGLAPREKSSLAQGYLGGPATADNPPAANLVNKPKDSK